MENKTLAPGTILPTGKVASPSKGTTIVLPKAGNEPNAKPIGETIVLPKNRPQNLGEAVVISTPAKKEVGQTITLAPAKKVTEEDVAEKETKTSSSVSKDEAEIGKDKTERQEDAPILKPRDDATSENEDDDEIEELTVVTDEAVTREQKPKARAAWSADGM